MTPAEREALARFGETLFRVSVDIADAFDSLGAAVIRGGEAFANLTLAVKACQEDSE